MKKINILLISILILHMSAASTFALTGAPELNDQGALRASRTAQRVERVQVKSDKKVMKLNGRAALEINRRTYSLKQLIKRISSIRRLTDSQKSSLTSEVQSEIDNLEKLLEKIKSDTDPNVLKTDVQQIIKSHRIYLLLMPKLQIIAAADRIINVADELTILSSSLQSKINDAKNAGSNVSALQGLTTDMSTKITDAKNQANNAINTVISLKPDGYPQNASSLKSARKLIQAGHADLVEAHHDSEIIRQALKGFENKSTLPKSKQTP